MKCRFAILPNEPESGTYPIRMCTDTRGIRGGTLDESHACRSSKVFWILIEAFLGSCRSILSKQACYDI